MLVVSNDWAASGDGKVFFYAGKTKDEAVKYILNGNIVCNRDVIDENRQRCFYIGRISYFVPEVDGERVIEDIVEQCANTIDDGADDYLDDVHNKLIDELGYELSKVFVAWEKKYNLSCSRFLVEDRYIEKIEIN